MNSSSIRVQNINDFFEIYANALVQHNTKGMAYLHHVPCTMLSDDATTIFSDASKLEGFFNQGMSFYRQFGITHVRSDVRNFKLLTERICEVKVQWQYLDAFKQPIYSCDYHYVMKLDKYNTWKIILSVSVNEKERMEEWKSASEKA